MAASDALAFPEFAEHLVRRHEKRVFLEDASDNHHWVSPHDV